MATGSGPSYLRIHEEPDPTASASPSATIVVVGEVDLDSAPLLWDALRARRDLDRPASLDLAGVTFADCSLLRVLFGARRRDPALRVARLSEAVRRLVWLTGTGPALLDQPAAAQRPRPGCRSGDAGHDLAAQGGTGAADDPGDVHL